MPSPEPNHLRIVAFVGDTIYYLTTIKQYGVKGPQNISAATAVTLYWENGAGVHQPAINVTDALPGADWANGVVALPINPSNFTAAEDTYSFSLVISLGGQDITYTPGTVDVRERPGYPGA